MSIIPKHRNQRDLEAARDPDWTLDDDGCLRLTIEGATVWIQARPPYCDRGHYWASVQGIPTIDGADCFPRYYMNVERAKAELHEWLRWRLSTERGHA